MATRSDSLDQLLARLNISQTTSRDTALYEVIKELIKRLKEISIAVGSSSGGSSITNLTEIQQFINPFIDSGDDGLAPLVPGQTGPVGVDGISNIPGPAGPITVGPMGLDGEDGLPGYPIPGNQGIQGIQGIDGPQGPITLGPMGLNGEDGMDGFPIPGPSGRDGDSWTLIEARPCSATANEDFINLSAYNEIFVFAVFITKAISGTLLLRVSTDNGATFLTTSGDYQSLANTGVGTNLTNMIMHSTNATAVRTCYTEIKNFNGSSPHYAQSLSATSDYIIPTTTPLNAIRVFGSAGGNLTGGTIYVFGR